MNDNQRPVPEVRSCEWLLDFCFILSGYCIIVEQLNNFRKNCCYMNLN